MKIPPRTTHESDLAHSILYSTSFLQSASRWRLSSRSLNSSPSPQVQCLDVQKSPGSLQYAVSVESTFVLEVKVKACTIFHSQWRFQSVKVQAAVRFPVVLPGPLTEAQICLLHNITSSLKCQCDSGSNYNSRYTCKMVFGRRLCYLLKGMEVQMPRGSCVCKVNGVYRPDVCS